MVSSISSVTLKCIQCQSTALAETGAGLTCTACNASYPRIKDVPRFVGAEFYSGSFGYQWNRFSRTQLDSANGSSRSRDAFVEKTGWRLEDLKGKTILDAGCGMGRFAEVAADAGAEVHGVDLSTAVEAAARNIGARANVNLYQADIFKLPFADGSFDYIYSLGVLHHTPDTRKAFLSLTRLLKPGGKISIWVYVDAEFIWKYRGDEILRPLTTRLPKPLLLSLCRVAVPLYYVHKLPKLGTLSFMMMPTSLDPDPGWRWLDTFDWYSPKYQFKHTQEEVRGWFREAGMTDIKDGPFAVSVFGAKPAV
jgi:SAM-dependent methyltransferase